MLGILETRPDASTGRLMTESIARIEDTAMGQVTYSEWAAYVEHLPHQGDRLEHVRALA